MWRGERRSARILELEAKKTQNKGKVTCDAARDVVTEDSNLTQRKKKVKSTPVQDLVANTVEYQLKKEAGNSSNEDHCTNDVSLSSGTVLPERRKLELLLGILKRRDSHNLFAEAVNPEEVKDYYDIIKEPMDFGTISAKLNGQSYRTLEEFEHDVFLVWNNAMLFNLSTTTYYRQACAIRDLAERLFDALKNDPENFESSHSMIRLRATKRAKTEVNIQNSSHRSTNGMASKGCRGERSSEHSEVDQHETYRPLNTLPTANESIESTVYCSSKQLVQTKQNSIGYQENLMQFVGPTAQMVAEHNSTKGAEDLNPHNATSNFQCQAPYQILNVASSQMVGPTAQMVAEHNSGKGAEDLNPHNVTSNYQRRALGQMLNMSSPQMVGPTAQMVAEKNSDLIWQQFKNITDLQTEDLNPDNATSNFQCRARALGQIHNVASINSYPTNPLSGSSSSMNSLFGDGKGKNVLIADVHASDIRREIEKIHGPWPFWSAARLPQFVSGPSQSPALGPSYLGGGAHQFQPVAGRGSTHYGSNVEQASQGLNLFRPTELGPQQPFFNKLFEQQSQNTSTSGTSRSAIELSDIDEWLSVGRRRDGSSNTRDPPASSQGQAATAGTDNFPWTLRL
ncbi:bromodomain-containing protein 3-like [Prunus avium]|uniref:Bromodomain-containing protein 3-like n=1 Tax=Prunus avium TaxID=42229 RepID=A0A6P5TNF6_PRUAV|nr:bromodomain-containing protein 3-like [Prunus avium]XP_021828538.1 bromodomain-containing protein 3-like [Prunus avium]XP_021828539.1 bromodomain-containing protein 3-like [Prunus avium]XP_021828540.1 bromodomain-containing protein 3-like [Prunus avium]